MCIRFVPYITPLPTLRIVRCGTMEYSFIWLSNFIVIKIWLEVEPETVRVCPTRVFLFSAVLWKIPICNSCLSVAPLIGPLVGSWGGPLMERFLLSTNINAEICLRGSSYHRCRYWKLITFNNFKRTVIRGLSKVLSSILYIRFVICTTSNLRTHISVRLITDTIVSSSFFPSAA